MVLTRAERASLRPACKKDKLLNPEKYERIEKVLHIMLLRYDNEMLVHQTELQRKAEEYSAARSNLLKAHIARRQAYFGNDFASEADFDRVVEAGERVVAEALKVDKTHNERKEAIEAFIETLHGKINVLNVLSALKCDKKLDEQVLAYGK